MEGQRVSPGGVRFPTALARRMAEMRHPGLGTLLAFNAPKILGMSMLTLLSPVSSAVRSSARGPPDAPFLRTTRRPQTCSRTARMLSTCATAAALLLACRPRAAETAFCPHPVLLETG